MSLRKLPDIKAFVKPQSYQADAPSNALDKWVPLAAEADGNVISVYDVIGSDWNGEGVTAKRVAGALRAIGKNDVTVNVNSPGGDMFEGLAIYNILREHPAKVTVRVMGLASKRRVYYCYGIRRVGDGFRVYAYDPQFMGLGYGQSKRHA
ncbi:MAG: ATP-dependent Clp protease proteolytic subunit [Ahrensia sp.]|nr:ATP-dependent Clp protease proteolytic subunit [Ahrensia sp.]